MSRRKITAVTFDCGKVVRTAVMTTEVLKAVPAASAGRRCGNTLRDPHLYANVIRMTQQAHTTSVLSVRVTPDERAILEAAAEQSRTTLSDFMRRKSVEAAEIEALNRSVVTIPAKDWEAFDVWINRDAEPIPALAKLASRVPSWER
jgi:uncharacterized protein (DUF1778 family)